MAGRLVRLHHSLDPKRFIALEPVEEGYGRWLVRELSRREALVLVAERVDGGIVGYVYGTLEDLSYQDLRGECGYLHDLWVEDHARRAGIATALVEQACALFTARGAPRVVLMAASRNPAAHALFARLGFRDTMVEMTRELRAE
jgi:ribosomal protein S18 acetylase RimI-like enzyme